MYASNIIPKNTISTAMRLSAWLANEISNFFKTQKAMQTKQVGQPQSSHNLLQAKPSQGKGRESTTKGSLETGIIY